MVRRLVGSLAAAAVTLLVTGCGSESTPTDSIGPPERNETSGTGRAGPVATSPSGETALVLRVEDGDSIVVELAGAEEKVRLIGINTPERGECLGDTARAALVELVEGREVVLEVDVETTDQFGRMLRYVWSDGHLVNAQMAGRGLAIARAFEPNTGRQQTLEDAEAVARQEMAGLWDPGACGSSSDARLEIIELSENPPGRDEDDLNGEFLVIRNVGDDVDLSDHMLRDGSSVNRYQFPDGFVLEAGSTVTIHVGCGQDDDAALYWCASGPVWDNRGDQAFVVAPGGGFIATFEYP